MSTRENPRIRVRGRDFTGYRIGGAIVAVLMLVALAIQTFELFDGDARTVPEVRWAVLNEDDPSPVIVDQTLRTRTWLMAPRDESGPSPDGEMPTFKVGNDILFTDIPIDEPDSVLTRSWAIPDDQSAGMLRQSERIIGISSLPYSNADLFERPFGRDWRLGIADIATHLGAYVILGFTLLLALILAIRGRVPVAEGKSGRTIQRFNFLERANHWMTAGSFIMLALTGMVVAYGETLILPFGDETLGNVGWWSTWGHAMFAPPFALGLLVMIALWTFRNLPSRLDLAWLRRFGGFFSDSPDNPPARKFNAGQKLIFWSAVLGGLIMIGSGVLLWFPFFFVGLEGMSWAMLTHAVVALFLVAIFIGHIYIGTVGMQDAFWAMWNGQVDRNWAKEHHDLWLAEIDRKGR